MKNLIVVTLILAFSTGCMGPQIKPEAFGKNKRYAVISIIGSTDITDANSGASGGYGSGSLLGAISAAASSDINFSEDSSKMFNKTQKIIDKEFAKSKSFKYVPSRIILNSKSYKKAKGEEPKFGIFTLGLAPEYKYFTEKSIGDIKNIIKANRLDGIIVINSAFSYSTGGLNVGGLVSVGRTKGQARFVISASDKDMKPVWTEQIVTTSDEGIANLGGAPSFKKLYPLLEQATESAIKDAMKNLDNTIYAKK